MLSQMNVTAPTSPPVQQNMMNSASGECSAVVRARHVVLWRNFLWETVVILSRKLEHG